MGEPLEPLYIAASIKNVLVSLYESVYGVASIPFLNIGILL